MEKRLLREYYKLNYDKQKIFESRDANQGKIILSGVFQAADRVNQNKRLYPRSVLEREVKNFLETAVRGGYACGELDHSQTSVVELKNVSHRILDLWWEGDEVCGRMEVLTGAPGKHLESLINDGVTVGISSRAVGSTKRSKNKEAGEDIEEVGDDLEIITWDVVSTPSVHNAFLHLSEAKNVDYDPKMSFTKEQRIYRIINKILEK